MPSSENVLHLPSGLLDLDADRAVVAGPDGTIEQIALATGDVKARSDHAGQPLTIAGGVAIAWRPESVPVPGVTVFGLSATAGALATIWHHRIDLPVWANTSSDEPDSFGIRAEAIDDELVAVRWFARSRYEGGAPPSVEAETAATDDAEGVLVVHARTGDRVDAPAAVTAPAELGLGTEPPLPIGEGEQAMSYRSTGGRTVSAWAFGTGRAQLVKEGTDGPIHLIRQLDGETIRAAMSSAPAADVVVTLDGELVLVHEPGTRVGSWRAVRVDTGDDVALLPLGEGVAAAALVDGDLVVAEVREPWPNGQRRLLVCVRLTDGDRLWSHVLDESVQRAAPPLPP